MVPSAIRRLAAFFLALALLAPSVHAAKPVPAISADAAILIDAVTGQVLYNKNMHKKKYPASTTKIITALLALENLELDEVVTIDAESPFAKGSKIYLIEGERITVETLLYALLVESANDAAVALAKRISGSTEDFAKLMNKRAEELGALNTSFANPNGLENEEHLTSAYDLAMIAKEAMQNEMFRKIVSTYTYTIPPTNMQPEQRYLHNTNRLLYDEVHKVVYEGAERPMKYSGVTGIKTGFTSQAGNCLVAGASREGTELISVVLQTDNSSVYLDSISLLEFGFSNFRTVLAVESGTEAGAIKVKSGEVREVQTRTGSDGWVTLPADAAWSEISREVENEPVLEAPVKEGDKVGSMEVSYGGDVLCVIDIVAAGDVSKGGMLSHIGIEDSTAGKIRNVALALIASLLLLLTAYVMLKRRQVRMKKQRRAERAARYAEESRRSSEEARRM
ncbi:MAG: D-alanyl-D-alanine carboxypeptidase [Clostridiales Family XIII bacterium]|jgi:D-alanyl-D-alanine carboxypeptidase (penicillin-binding protein 5/6)|nr:D-alanyl-D-alanine carboxypeptidase [Clostridiales Family XIII bacterium]